jgi:hypothetical protein
VNLLERDGPLSAIERTLDGARQGQGGTLFVVGEPGLGKTALLAECSARAVGFSIGRAACSDLIRGHVPGCARRREASSADCSHASASTRTDDRGSAQFLSQRFGVPDERHALLGDKVAASAPGRSPHRSQAVAGALPRARVHPHMGSCLGIEIDGAIPVPEAGQGAEAWPVRLLAG